MRISADITHTHQAPKEIFFSIEYQILQIFFLIFANLLILKTDLVDILS